ncbi:MAG: hypothetical protein ACRENN_05305 [Candidatus Eiseniibacteriota bacterium]
MAKLTRIGTFVVAALSLLPALALDTRDAVADSFVLIHANVVWTQGNRVYIASRDSVTIPPATQLTFRYKQDTIATGEVSAIYQSELIAAVLTSGSLSKAKQLDKVEITARPPEFHPPPLLRVGYPATGRKNLLFDCTRLEPDTTVLQGAYRPELLAKGSYRFVRDPSYSVAREWPDTLVVRLFDEVADEEIALERGDVDVAVFWPGEASTHIREAMGWKDQPFGLRHGLYIAATVPLREEPHLYDGEFEALKRMNQTLFHGDLLAAPHGVRLTTVLPPKSRFDVDPALPGRDILQAFLNAGSEVGSGQDPARIIRMHLEVRGISPRPSGSPGASYDADDLGLGDGPAALMTPRLPVIPVPSLRTYIARIGADQLVGLFTCSRGSTKP